MTRISGIGHAFGWLRDLPDLRDLKLQITSKASWEDVVDLTEKIDIPRINQGQLGSCTAHAIAAADMYDQVKQGISPTIPSRLYIYYYERLLENSTQSDSGAAIRDGIKTLARRGAPTEDLWTYDISKFKVQPPTTLETNALSHKLIEYRSVKRTEYAVEDAIASGYPIVFGIPVYQSIESLATEQTGEVQTPTYGDKLLGGHALLAVGYNRKTRRIKFDNWWGEDWGGHGYGTIPFEYFFKSASDLWVMTRIMAP